MTSLHRLALLLSVISLASSATISSSASAGGGGLSNRGGSAISTSSRFGGGPTRVTSSTSGTGQTSFSSHSGPAGTGFNSLGNRGGFGPVSVPHVPRVPTFQFRPIAFPQLSAPQFQQPTTFGTGLSTRFGGSRPAAGTFHGTGVNAIDTTSFLNRISSQINHNFAANLGR